MYRKTESLSQAMYRLNPTKGRDENMRKRHAIYIPSRHVDDRCVLMLVPTLHWYCLSKHELLKNSQSSDLKKAIISIIFFSSECVRYGNTSLHCCFVVGNSFLPNVLLRLSATCSLCHMQLLLLQSVAAAEV